MTTDNRPLSPHLQVYKPQITSALSILHRLTGVALAVGTLILVYWLVAAAAGPEAYLEAREVLDSWLVKLILFGFTFALFYHLANGIRHLCWDLGFGFEITTVALTGKIVLAAAGLLTLVAWMLA